MRPGIDPKVDYAFKRLFGREQNIPLLLNLLNAVLQPPPGQAVVALELLNPFNDKDGLDDKLSILDIKARDQQGRQFNVEMQMLPDLYLPKRITYYLARLHQAQLHEGEEYQVLQPTCAICFVNSVTWRQVHDYHLRFRLLEERHRFAFTDDLAVHILELPKFTKPAEELTSPLDVWLYFLLHAEEMDTEGLPPALQKPEIRQALGELTMLTQSDLERERYEARVKWERDQKSRLSSAETFGEVLGRIHLCERRLNRPLTAKEDLRGLTLEELTRRADELERELEGRAEGETRAELWGRIHLCQRRLNRPLTPKDELRAMTPDELERLARALELDLFGP